MLLSGSIAGMLLARAFAGMLGGWLGWRAPSYSTLAYACAHAGRRGGPALGRAPTDRILLAPAARREVDDGASSQAAGSAPCSS